MARIRSLHPTQWTDEEFVTCSPLARLLALGLRNEADDQGVFEWKPLTLKMRLLPADGADVGELLAELEESGQVRRFEAGGKRYGAIRNFGKFQSPKKPTAQYPLPNELRTYVGAKGSGSEPDPRSSEAGSEPKAVEATPNSEPVTPCSPTASEAVPHQYPTGSQPLPPGEERRGVGEEEGSSVSNDTGVPPCDAKAKTEPEDPDAALYRRGREVLGAKAGATITKLKKAKGSSISGARAVIEAASTKDQPMEYVQGAIRNAGKQAGPGSWGQRDERSEDEKLAAARAGEDAQWRSRLKAWQGKGTWLTQWGAPPDSPRTGVPAEILGEFGIGGAAAAGASGTGAGRLV